jgi:hypothetical protein
MVEFTTNIGYDNFTLELMDQDINFIVKMLESQSLKITSDP